MTIARPLETEDADLAQPLRWMAAVDTLRQQQADAPLTVDTLAPQIQAFYAQHQMALAPGEARAAAEHCLSGAPLAPLKMDLPWARPSTKAEWNAAIAAAQTALDKSTRRVILTVSGIVLALAVGVGALVMGHGDPIEAAIGGSLLTTMFAGAFGAIFGSICLDEPRARIKALRKAIPAPEELLHIRAWARQPQLARWLAQLHLNEVPLLIQDLAALRNLADRSVIQRQTDALGELLDEVVLSQVVPGSVSEANPLTHDAPMAPGGVRVEV